jgi:hypothetical protein
MMADLSILETREIGQFASLKAVPSGENNFISSRLHLPDDGKKEWNMRRVLEVDPDFIIFSVRISQTSSSGNHTRGSMFAFF